MIYYNRKITAHL